MKKLSISIVVLSLLFAGCTPPYNPFKITKEDIHTKVKTVGLMPLFIQTSVSDPNKAKEEFENKITEKLKLCGFSVVPSSEYYDIYKQFKDSIGPMYDPCTGKIIEEKFSICCLYERIL